MSTFLTTYGKNLFANHVFQTSVSAPLPASYYIGLSSAAPGVDGSSFTEPASATAYARLGVSGLEAAVDGVVLNGATLSFAESAGNQGVITHWGLFDASADGNLLMFGELPKSRSVEDETTLSIKPGTLKFEIVGYNA